MLHVERTLSLPGGPMATEAHSPFLNQARERKAHAISRLIWSHMTPEQRTDPRMADRVAAMDQGERDAWAWQAAVMVPSQESWDLVVAKIRERVLDEMHWRGVVEAAS